MTVGLFLGKSVDRVGKIFSISANTLDEPVSALEQMASQASQLITSTIENSGIKEDTTRAYEISVDFSKGYYGFAVRYTNAEGEKLILAVAAKSIPVALFSYAVESCKNKIYTIIEGLAKEGRVSRELVRDLHLTLEREVDSFRL